MQRLLFSLLFVGFAASIAGACTPDPTFSECTLDATGSLYLCPNGVPHGDCTYSPFWVTVRDTEDNPCPGTQVRVVIGGQSSGHIGICPNQTLTLTTGALGGALFNIGGGGCYKHRPGAVRIEAQDGSGAWITIRSYSHITSSDYANSDDNGVPYRWNHCVDPVDLGDFVQAYQGGTGPASCHDYNNSGGTDPPDLAAFVDAYRGGTRCCPPNRRYRFDLWSQ